MAEEGTKRDREWAEVLTPALLAILAAIVLVAGFVGAEMVWGEE